MNILPVIVKIFEKFFIKQGTKIRFWTLSTPLEKQAVSNSKAFGALLTDLSKAFHCLPHKLLIAKIKCIWLSSKNFEINE